MGNKKSGWLAITVKSLLETTALKRRAFFILADIAIISLSMYSSFWLRYDGKITEVYLRNIWIYISLALVFKMSMIAVHGLYNLAWRFIGLKDILRLIQAIIIGFLLMAIVLFFLKPFEAFNRFPRSVFLLDFNFTCVLLCALRISKRALHEYRYRMTALTRDKKRILIIGTESVGEQIVKDMLDSRKSDRFPIGFIDDNESKQSVSIHGVKVLGKREDIPKILAGNDIEEILIAIPSVHSKDIREVIELIRKTGKGKKTKVLPGIHDVIEGKVSLTDIKDVEVEDLLGRDPVRIDFEKIRLFLKRKKDYGFGCGRFDRRRIGQDNHPVRTGAAYPS